jgi:hypothetical protein
MVPMSFQFNTAPAARRQSRLATAETPEETVEQAIASGRLEGVPEPTPEAKRRLVAIARGERTADEVVEEITARYA